MPVVKVMCGNMFSGLLTASGQVYTWGDNQHGKLGLRNQEVQAAQGPTLINLSSQEFVKDIACGFDHCVALTAKNELYVWGRRMAIYPNVQLTYQYLKSNLNMLRIELDQPYPRLVKNNLIFYKIKRLECGPFNTAIVSEDGDLLIMGSNDSGQLALGDEIGQMVPFFPEFRKIDTFGKDLQVFDVGLGAASTHILARDVKQGANKMYACGENEHGQLGNGTNL